jgi:hypothetical protein
MSLRPRSGAAGDVVCAWPTRPPRPSPNSALNSVVESELIRLSSGYDSGEQVLESGNVQAH